MIGTIAGVETRQQIEFEHGKENKNNEAQDSGHRRAETGNDLLPR